MKTIVIITAFIAYFSLNVAAQDDHKYDPTYSIHNYKHPNKAREAQQKIKYEKSESYYYVIPSEVEINRNYKQQNNLSKVNTKGIKRFYNGEIIPAKREPKNVNSVFSNRNYKRQF